MSLTPEAIEKLEAQHGKLRLFNVKLPSGVTESFAFRFPARAQYQMWRAAEKREDPEAQERLVIGMCVSHTREQFNAILETPGNAALADVLASHIGKWLNPTLEEEGKD